MTSCKDAIKAWETADGKVAAEAEDVRLCPISLQLPVIQKMDASLSSLKKCKHLRLSTNSIDKITGLNGMECLTILSIGRNQIKSVAGLEAVQDTLEQLWVSYNQIASLSGIEKLHNLQVLYMSNNKIASWSEVERLKDLPKLRDLLMVGNPLWTKHTNEENNWRVEVLKRLPNIKVRTGCPGCAVAWRPRAPGRIRGERSARRLHTARIACASLGPFARAPLCERTAHTPPRVPAAHGASLR